MIPCQEKLKQSTKYVVTNSIQMGQGHTVKKSVSTYMNKAMRLKGEIPTKSNNESSKFNDTARQV